MDLVATPCLDHSISGSPASSKPDLSRVSELAESVNQLPRTADVGTTTPEDIAQPESS